MKDMILFLLVFSSFISLPRIAAETNEPWVISNDTFKYNGHLQGLSCDENAIYWSFTDHILKTDWNGKEITEVPVDSHCGDCCLVNGKLYFSVLLRDSKKIARKGGNSWVYVMSTDLELLKTIPVPEAKNPDGITWLNGSFYIASDPVGHDLHSSNPIICYDENFNFKNRYILKTGFDTRFGVQTMTTYKDQLLISNYSTKPTFLISEDCNVLKQFALDGSTGTHPVPEKIARGKCLYLFSRLYGKKPEPKKHPRKRLWAPRAFVYEFDGETFQICPKPQSKREVAAPFPITVQFSPVPDAPGWRGGDQKLDEALVLSTLDNIVAHGCSSLYLPQSSQMGAPVPEALHPLIADAARARGMKVTWQTHGLELFNRRQPPRICVYSPHYAEAVRENVAKKLAPLMGRTDIERVFCYQDEPFHQGAESFGTNDEVKVEFRERYGYDLPPSHESVRNDPVKWLDVINFRSDYFPDGWRQTYQAIKATNANFKVIMTHDSHGTFGGAAGSDARLFVDDVYHWGGEFADTFVYDSYPYMMTDFRYGECSRIVKPRMSQFHYSFAQMRNVTRAYGKELGFWFGTYNPLWFRNFLGEDLRRMTWSERETATTAVAQGADFLIFGLGIPQDAEHWRELGKGLNLIQRCGPGLRLAPKVKAKAAFLFPRTQCVQLQEEYWNVGLSFELFLRAFGELDVLHEEQVTNDTLNDYEMLCLFDIRLLPEDVAARIAAFVDKGGVVIADCVPQLGRHKAPMKSLMTLFGVDAAETDRVTRSGLWLEYRAIKPRYARPLVPEKVNTARVRSNGLGQLYDFTIASPRLCSVTDGEILLKTQDARPALIHRKSGRGSAWLLGFCAQDSYFQAWKTDDGKTRRQLYQLLSAIAEKSGVRPRVRSSNPDVEASVRANAREAYLFAIDHEAPIKTTRISLADLPFKIRRVTDIESGQDVALKRQRDTCVIDVDLSGGVTKIMRLTSAR